ncbi:hypothetical protein PI124_g10801 [Phytophthora idaei]|nr:hypothetical protein PI125_g19375 [Phytophthora idaei]KAG3139436.1 hypothetical protein PI126_g16465 [Phytophthora idaei]KAG3244415.1 hypothetical protein PI124_g10801 [Phytophthora idaei]
MVRDLMTLRYKTQAERFSKATNNGTLKEAWLLLDTELSDNQETPISSDQCQNMLKWLKRKWAEYTADLRATGKSGAVVKQPPGLDLMHGFWSGPSVMSAQVLADSEADGVATLSDGNAGSDDESSQKSPDHQGRKGKKRNTIGDSFEIGMQSIADGLSAAGCRSGR